MQKATPASSTRRCGISRTAAAPPSPSRPCPTIPPGMRSATAWPAQLPETRSARQRDRDLGRDPRVVLEQHHVRAHRAARGLFGDTGEQERRHFLPREVARTRVRERGGDGCLDLLGRKRGRRRNGKQYAGGEAELVE